MVKNIKNFIIYAFKTPAIFLYKTANIFFGALLWYSPWRKKFLNKLFDQKKNMLESMFRYFLLDYLFYTDVQKYRNLIVAQEPGDIWCDEYRSRRNEYEKKLHYFFDSIETSISSYRLNRIMQVGCGGGGELYHLSKKFPQLNFIGVDLNKNTIEKNREIYKELKNLEFVCGNIFTINVFEDYRPQLVFTSGTAEYFTEEELKNFIRTAKEKNVNIIFFYEPITKAIFNYSGEIKSKPRGGMAFNHNYSFHLKEYDFQVTEDFEYFPSQPDVFMVLAVGIRNS